MATIELNGETKEVNNNEPIQLACQEMGLPFGCRSGLCRTCEIVVEEGMENLSNLNQLEKQHDLPPQHRLACQCVIKSGKVKLKAFLE